MASYLTDNFAIKLMDALLVDNGNRTIRLYGNGASYESGYLLSSTVAFSRTFRANYQLDPVSKTFAIPTSSVFRWIGIGYGEDQYLTFAANPDSPGSDLTFDIAGDYTISSMELSMDSTAE